MHEASKRTLRRRCQSLTGALLLSFLGLHLVAVWPLRAADPSAFVLGAALRYEQGHTRLLASAVLALALVHAALEFWRWRSTPPAGPTARGLDRVQLVAGVVALAFLVGHVLQLRVLETGPHLGAYSAYGALQASLGRPLPLLGYVAGLTATCFYAAFGLARFVSGRAEGTLATRLSFGALAGLLWGLWLQPLASVALGLRLW